MQQYKHKTTVIIEMDMAEIIRNLRAVDEVVIVDTLDKVEIPKACEK